MCLGLKVQQTQNKKRLGHKEFVVRIKQTRCGKMWDMKHPHNYHKTEKPRYQNVKAQPQIPQENCGKVWAGKASGTTQPISVLFPGHLPNQCEKQGTELNGHLVWLTIAALIFFNLATSPVWACFKIQQKHFTLLGKNNVGLVLISCWGWLEFPVLCIAEVSNAGLWCCLKRSYTYPYVSAVLTGLRLYLLFTDIRGMYDR